MTPDKAKQQRKSITDTASDSRFAARGNHVVASDVLTIAMAISYMDRKTTSIVHNSIIEKVSEKMGISTTIHNHNMWPGTDTIINPGGRSGATLEIFNSEYGGRMSRFEGSRMILFNGIVMAVEGKEVFDVFAKWDVLLSGIRQSLEEIETTFQQREECHPDQREMSEIPLLFLIAMDEVHHVFTLESIHENIHALLPEKIKWRLVTYKTDELDDAVEGFEWLLINARKVMKKSRRTFLF